MISGNEQSSGKIRKGQKKPYRKANAQTVSERIELVAEMLARGANSRQIRLTLARKPHFLEWRAAVEYIARAREWLLKQAAGMDKRQALAESIQYWRSVIADEKADYKDRNYARTRLDFIFGLDAPKPRWQPDLPPPQTPADDAARALDGGMLNALELVYGEEAKREAIEIAVKQLPAPAPAQKIKLKLA